MVDKSHTPLDFGPYGSYYETSSVTSNFWQKKADGEFLPDNYYSFQRVDGYAPLVMTYSGLRNEFNAQPMQGFEKVCIEGEFRPIHAPAVKTGIKRDTLEDIVTNKLIERARDIDFDAGVALGEYRETARFVADSFTKYGGALLAAKKGNFSEATRRLRGQSRHQGNLKKAVSRPSGNPSIVDIANASADTWLELQLAAKPLLSDVSAAIEVLNDDLIKSVGTTLTLRASHEASYSGWSDVHLDNGIASVKDWHSSTNGSCRVSGKLRVQWDDPIFTPLEQLGLTNPLSVAWELVPLSFLVDYVIPVGDFIRNVFPPNGFKHVSGYTYAKGEGWYNQSTDIGKRATAPGWHTYANEVESFKIRKVLETFPKWKFIIPDLSLSKTQVGNAVAIVWNALVTR